MEKRLLKRKEDDDMNLLELDVIDNLFHSSSISKGIERTMEEIINELEVDSMYILHYEEGITEPEVAYDWEKNAQERNIDFQHYIESIEEWYHFDEDDLYVARATMVVSPNEKSLYMDCGYQAVVEFQMKNHGNVIGYILLGWERIKELSEEDEKDLHILLRLMNEMLVKQFEKDRMGLHEGNLFQLVSDMTNTIFYLVDDEYKIQFINDYAKAEYPSVCLGDCCYQAIQGKDTPCVSCPIRELEDGQYMEEYRYIPYLDASFYIDAKPLRLSKDKKGYALTLQRQFALQEIQQREVIEKKFIYDLKLIYKAVIAVEIGRDRFIDFFEKDMEESASYSKDFVIQWLSRIHIDDKQMFLEYFDINYLQDAYQSGESKKEMDFRYRTHAGNYHYMNGQILFSQSANKDIVVYILFKDVEQEKSTQIKEYTQLRDSLMAAKFSAQLKGEVLANISHEIRTPMSGIVSMASVARQVYKQEDKLLDCLASIDDYAEHMMQVMDYLLESVKINSDTIVINKQLFRLEQLLNRLDIAVREQCDKKNIQFYMEQHCQYNQLLGDDNRLYQAIYTLVCNAISYTPVSGKISLTVNQIAADEKNVYIRFMLDDTGNGLTENMKESIFGFQKNGKRIILDEEHFDLSLATKIIQLMGGEIGVNLDEKGTHLYFTLQFGLEEEKKQTARKRNQLVVGNFEGRKVLLAEDNKMGQDALKAVLEVVGFEVEVVENGKKAVIAFISQPAFTYDAILMDVHMPLMDGREATRCIRISGKEDGETIPIIGLMANTYEEDIEESIQAGMQTHLPKPVDVEKLYRVLEKLIPCEEEN